MDFFEILHDRAHDKHPQQRYGDWADGIDATIETLQEMMIGEPMRAIIHHRTLMDKKYLFTYLHIAGHRGTDGQKVTVMVFADDEEA